MVFSKLLSLLFMANIFFAIGEECGQRIALMGGLVNFGNQSRLGEWPWHVALFHRMNRASPSYACGGTIVSESYVITAAHCTYPASRVRPLKAREILVRAGITNIQLLEHSIQQVALEQIIRHEEYNTESMEGDIALLKISGQLDFTNYVKPICFWKGNDAEDLIVREQGFIAGWGRDENQVLPDILKHAIMPIVSRKTCRDSDPNYYTRYLYDRKTFCAGFRNGTSAGLGDSGGGLYIETDGKWILRGIVSSGKINPITYLLDTKNFVVFTDVAYFLPWISKKLNISLADEELVQEDYAVCGNKKQPQFSRTGYKVERTWPWQGEVHKKDGKKPFRFCEAAIINENFMLSPAEVYSDSDARNPFHLFVVFKVFRIGENNTLLHQRLRRIIRHEAYDPQTRFNNIALLELNSPLTFTDFIRPVCLWKNDKAEWTTENSKGMLGEFETRIFNASQCVELFNVQKSLLDKALFCHQLSATKITVLSDLLYFKVNNRWFLRGISFNLIKKGGSAYVLLLDVAYYLNWINYNAVLQTQDLLALGNCIESSKSDWIYQIHSNSLLQCYASLIKFDLLLTTASCVEGIPLNELLVTNDHYQSVAEIRKIHLHPSFDNLTLANNIAILKLSETLDKNPICVPKIAIKPIRLGLKTHSWQTNYSRENLVEHTSANLTIINTRSCVERWRREGANVTADGGHICGQMVDVTKGQFFDCNSNMHGSPLTYRDSTTGRTYLRGVLDIGKNNHCEVNDLPEAYIDAMFYAQWISEIDMLDLLPIQSKWRTFFGKILADDKNRVEWRKLDYGNPLYSVPFSPGLIRNPKGLLALLVNFMSLI